MGFCPASVFLRLQQSEATVAEQLGLIASLNGDQLGLLHRLAPHALEFVQLLQSEQLQVALPGELLDDLRWGRH
jgi:hypothetical protein